MNYLLALLPILLLVALSLWRGVKLAVWVGWAVTTLLFFYWGAAITQYLGAVSLAFITTFNILLIVLGAVFLFTIMSHTGLIRQITHSLDDLHPSPELRFFLLALGLTAFFEGVAGFGTPGAIVPLILIAMGFGPILSVSVVLLFDGLFAAFGAVGTPLWVGLQIPLGLSNAEVPVIGVLAAAGLSVAGLLILWCVFRLMEQHHERPVPRKQVLLLYSFFAVPFCVLAWLIPEQATVLASLAMLAVSVMYLRKRGSALHLRPWIPYGALALLLLLPKIIEPLRHFIGWELVFTDMFGSDIRGSIRPLQSPLVPFAVVGLGVAYFRRSPSLYLGEPLRKMGSVFMVLFPSVVIAQLMVHSGQSQPSMVNHISALLSFLGPAYPVVAPFIGVIGTFITGSTTVSNVVLGPSQYETALSLKTNTSIILSLQLAGASVGNAICLFNIIAAASVANIRDYKKILAINLLPTLLAALLIGLLGLGLIFLRL